MAQRALPVVRTADDLALLPDDGNRYELIDGVLYVTPAPRVKHHYATDELYARIRAYARRHGFRPFHAPVAVRASALTEVQPDIFVLSHRPDLDDAWIPMARLLLAVEILSPSTRSRDRGIKRTTYLANGVDEYWTVDLTARSIEVWRSTAAIPERHERTVTWHPAGASEPLVIDVCALFGAILDGGTDTAAVEQS